MERPISTLEETVDGRILERSHVPQQNFMLLDYCCWVIPWPTESQIHMLMRQPHLKMGLDRLSMPDFSHFRKLPAYVLSLLGDNFSVYLWRKMLVVIAITYTTNSALRLNFERSCNVFRQGINGYEWQLIKWLSQFLSDLLVDRHIKTFKRQRS